MNILKLTFYFLLISDVFIINAQTYLNEGLYFASHEVIQDERTSLNITPDNPLFLKRGFTLEFDANFRKGDGYYGDIVRVIGDDKLNIDLVSNLNTNEANFWLVVKDTILFTVKWNEIPDGSFDKWINIKLKINQEDSIISLSLNGHTLHKRSKTIHGIKNYNIVFGASNIKPFITTDVCPMTLKNIKIFNHNSKLIRHWILGKHSKNNSVYDEISSKKALVYNPIWKIDRHLHWKKKREYTFDKLIGIAKDNINNRIFFIDPKAVYAYHLNSNHIDTLKYTGHPYFCQSNTFIYNKYTDELWSYNFDNEDINIFNIKNKSWSINNTNCLETDFWHHNKLISPKDSSLITFGGYGHYRYKNIIKNIRIDKNWTNYEIKDSISPRYLSGAGILDNDHFLIFGGYGSKTGRQEVNSEYYYDLYSINFNNFNISQKWKYTNTSDNPFVPLESLIIDQETRNFYTLVYNNSNFNTHLNLVRYSIDQPQQVLYQDSIPYNFLDVRSWGTLILNNKKNKLTAVTASDNTIKLYDLAYPPLLENEVFQDNPNYLINWERWLVFGMILILILFFIKQIISKFKQKENKISHTANYPKKINYLKGSKKRESAIYLLGGLQVYDREGKDITALFTPTLKSLFLLIVLYTVKNQKGISSIKLTELIWFDKSESSARNNRNVNISKLRILLEKIGNIEITNDNTYWKVSMDENIYCDYIKTIQVLDSLSEHPLKEGTIVKLLQTVSAGEICPNIQIEWMDTFKVDFSNRVINGLEFIAKSKTDPNLLNAIADCILKYDPLNEEAITLKCKSLYKIGKKGLAKQCYDIFRKEYEALLGTEFTKSFSNIIK
ncbi:hypothetical protein [Galbibacter pacificus]|uniref:Galactose oxidase n=1 Tax=Galbibacter pacificus TaxID=2996052 RepID=A0ABT6FMX3_9FLAO|nr:hypothetical protein [Galbibacter pacificus]MDG3581049.1 hypothetical protein [Galbibacter pacificus]MDG3584527.1 hypothetical protein [Galbibacter pacificus]